MGVSGKVNQCIVKSLVMMQKVIKSSDRDRCFVLTWINEKPPAISGVDVFDCPLDVLT